MQQAITIDDGLLKDAADYLAIDDVNEIINAALRELIKNHPLKSYKQTQRIAGLGTGIYWMSDDFDEALEDDFWLGDDNL